MEVAKTHETKGVLAKHYSFTDEELDFILSISLRPGINYDIKCRMRQDVGGANE